MNAYTRQEPYKCQIHKKPILGMRTVYSDKKSANNKAECSWGKPMCQDCLQDECDKINAAEAKP